MEAEKKVNDAVANRILIDGMSTILAGLFWFPILAWLETLGLSVNNPKLILGLVVITVVAVDWVFFRRGKVKRAGKNT